MQKPLPKSRPSRRLDYFRERDVRLHGAHSDSHSSDVVEEPFVADLVREMSALSIVHRLPKPQLPARGGKSAEATRVSLSKKHVKLYREQWDAEWVARVPRYGNDPAANNVSEVVRAKVFNWLMEIFIAYKLDKHAYFRAIALFDCHVKTVDKALSEADIQLWALTALFVAVKYESEGNKLTVEHLVHFARDKIPAEKFLAAEDRLFETLHYHVGFPTHLDILDELMLRVDFVFDSSYRLQQVAESVLIRCMLSPHILSTRPDVFCCAALIYTIQLFYKHYRAFLTAERRVFNKSDLDIKESFLVDRVIKIIRVNPSIVLSVRSSVQELVEDFDDYREHCGLNSIASLEDMDSL